MDVRTRRRPGFGESGWSFSHVDARNELETGVHRPGVYLPVDTRLCASPAPLTGSLHALCNPANCLVEADRDLTVFYRLGGRILESSTNQISVSITLLRYQSGYVPILMYGVR
jgi:hypothetical protein